MGHGGVKKKMDRYHPSLWYGMAWTKGAADRVPSVLVVTVVQVNPEHCEPAQLLADPNRRLLSMAPDKWFGWLLTPVPGPPPGPPPPRASDSWLLPMP